MLVLDTNVYIDVMDDPVRAARLAATLEDCEDSIAVSSVVVSELLIGLKDPRRRADLLRHVLDESDGLITPGHDDWLAAGDSMRSLGGNAATKRRSFWNDVLIAASCVRVGATLLTSNRGDFRRIRAAIPVHTVSAWG